ADYIIPGSDGHVFLNRGGDGHGGWVDLGPAAASLPPVPPFPPICRPTMPCRVPVVLLPDIDGDGKADLLRISTDGPQVVRLNRGGDGHGGWDDYGQIVSTQLGFAN